MYTQLLNYLKNRPEEYEADSAMLWNDEHISKGMLKAHLNPDIEAASRKHDFINESVKWLSTLCDINKGNKWLDLGCGPGIYAEKLDDMGFSITGIDFSKRSIEYARQSAASKEKNIEYIYQNYLDINYENQFDIATLVYCDFGVLKSSDREKLLLKIRQALKPGGKLILDGFTKYNYKDFIENQRIFYENSGYWSAVPYSCIERTFRYDETSLFLEQYIIITETTCKCYNNWNYAFARNNLQCELEKAGFLDFQFYADVTGKEFCENSKTICVVAK